MMSVSSPTRRPSGTAATAVIDDNVEKKIEILTKRHRFVEDRLKKIEKENEANCEIARQAQEAAEKLTEAQKADKKMILGLRTQLSGMKSRLDVMMSSNEMKEDPFLAAAVSTVVINSAAGGAVGSEMSHETTTSAWKEMIQRAVRFEIAKATEEIFNKCATEQLKVCARFHEKMYKQENAGVNVNENHDTFNRSVAMEQFSSMQKDLVRISADLDRMKLRQTQLDASLQQVKNDQSVRTIESVEHRNSMQHSQRAEVEDFLNRSQQKVTLALANVKRDTADIKQLKEELQSYVDHSGRVLAEHDTRLKRFDQSKGEIYNELERLGATADHLQQQVNDTEHSVKAFCESSSQLSASIELVHAHDDKLNALDEKVEALREECSIAAGIADANSTPLDVLANSITTINDKIDQRTDALQVQIEGVAAQSVELNKKMKTKLKDVVESVKGVANIRHSVESLVDGLDSRAPASVEVIRNLSSTQKKFDKALKEFASQMDRANLRMDQVDTNLQDYNSRSVILQQTVKDLEEVLTVRTRDEVKKEGEVVATLFSSQISELEVQLNKRIEECKQLVQMENDARVALHEEVEGVVVRVRDMDVALSDVHESVKNVKDEVGDEISKEVEMKLSEVRSAVSGAEGLNRELEKRVAAVEQNQIDRQEEFNEYQRNSKMYCDAISNRVGQDISSLSALLKYLEGKVNDQIASAKGISEFSEAQEKVIQRIYRLEQSMNAAEEMLSFYETTSHELKASISSAEDRIEEMIKSSSGAIVDVEKLDELEKSLVLVNEMTANLSAESKQLRNDYNQFVIVAKEEFNKNKDFTNNTTSLSENIDVLSSQCSRFATLEALEECRSSVRDQCEQISDMLQTTTDELQQEMKRNEQWRQMHIASESERVTMAQVEEAISSQDATARTRMASCERKVSSQEAFVKERLARIEERLEALHVAGLRSVNVEELEADRAQMLEVQQKQLSLEEEMNELKMSQNNHGSSITALNNEIKESESLANVDCRGLRESLDQLQVELREGQKKLEEEVSTLSIYVKQQEEKLNSQLINFDTQYGSELNQLESAMNEIITALEAAQQKIEVLQRSETTTIALNEIKQQINELTDRVYRGEIRIHEITSMMSEDILHRQRKQRMMIEEEYNSKILIHTTALNEQIERFEMIIKERLSMTENDVKKKIHDLSSLLQNNTSTSIQDEKMIDQRLNSLETSHQSFMKTIHEVNTKCDYIVDNFTKTFENVESRISTLENSQSEEEDHKQAAVDTGAVNVRPEQHTDEISDFFPRKSQFFGSVEEMDVLYKSL